MKTNWKEVSSDQWAQFLIQFDCYATEVKNETTDLMIHKIRGNIKPGENFGIGEEIGKVDYSEYPAVPARYFIKY